MSISINCGVCGTDYHVGNRKAGKTFRCKKCGAKIQAGAAMSVGRQWIESDDQSLQKTRSGLTLLSWGAIAVFLALVSLIAASRFMISGFAVTISVLALGMSMTLIGLMRCTATPESSGAKGLIVVATLCNFLGLLQALLDAFVSGGIPEFLGLIMALSGPCGTVSLLLYMKKLSEFIERPDLASRALMLLLAAVGFVGLIVMMFFMMRVLRGAGGSVIGPIFGVAGLLIFVMFVSLTRSLANALRNTSSGAASLETKQQETGP